MTRTSRTLSILMISRTSVRSIVVFVDGRKTPTSTLVFGLPRNRLTMPSIVEFVSTAFHRCS